VFHGVIALQKNPNYGFCGAKELTKTGLTPFIFTDVGEIPQNRQYIYSDFNTFFAGYQLLILGAKVAAIH